jgi:hypothetical protein
MMKTTLSSFARRSIFGLYTTFPNAIKFLWLFRPMLEPNNAECITTIEEWKLT